MVLFNYVDIDIMCSVIIELPGLILLRGICILGSVIIVLPGLIQLRCHRFSVFCDN